MRSRSARNVAFALHPTRAQSFRAHPLVSRPRGSLKLDFDYAFMTSIALWFSSKEHPLSNTILLNRAEVVTSGNEF